MKIFTLFLAVFVPTASVAQNAQNTKPMTSAALEAEVLQVIKHFNDVFARTDVEKYFTYIDPQITVLTPSNPYRVDGIHDDREEFEYSLRTGVSRVGYFQEMQPKVQLFSESAVVTYYSRGSYGAEGQEKVAFYKETDVLARRTNGWKVVHIHVSATR